MKTKKQIPSQLLKTIFGGSAGGGDGIEPPKASANKSSGYGAEQDQSYKG
ncbi:hypothetical protein CWC29_022715 [Pseudoalteromonas sp. S4498]|uniref:Uncharacterized protein n=1 Tax=Pseudoalteromonas galatheae TaxID=579562 RepID=A0A8T6YVB2_9GAMM|nr:hypothetical protein [Pseudoalteromonas galatheae]NKC21593.1 hypothetical protein [Pseudoalteromonas galatheae]